MTPTRRAWLAHLIARARAAGARDVLLLGQRLFAGRQVVVDTAPLITGYATLDPVPPDTPRGLDIALVPVRHLASALELEQASA